MAFCKNQSDGEETKPNGGAETKPNDFDRGDSRVAEARGFKKKFDCAFLVSAMWFGIGAFCALLAILLPA